MAVKDIKSNLVQTLALSAAVATDTTTQGAILDTADKELGLMFGVQVSDFTDGEYTLLLEESDDPGMAGAVPITGDKLIGDLPVVIAATVVGDPIPTVGVISNLKHVRASVVSASTATGATVTVIATEKAELAPVV